MKEQLQSAVKEAMKAKNKVVVETLRSVLTAIQYEEIEKKVEPLPNDGILAIMQRELKKRREEIEFAEKANRPELKEKFLLEIAAIEKFLPQQLSASEIENILNQIKASTPGANMGMAMKGLKEKFAGQYDSKAASEIAKRVFG